jgi:hypothetical protein
VLGNMVAGGCSLFGAGFFSELEVMRTDRLQCRPSGPRVLASTATTSITQGSAFWGCMVSLGLWHVSAVN